MRSFKRARRGRSHLYIVGQLTNELTRLAPILLCLLLENVRSKRKPQTRHLKVDQSEKKRADHCKRSSYTINSASP
ncbi:hypothetical protein BDW75DRAFT_224428 [Aspergillus navahoensis]